MGSRLAFLGVTLFWVLMNVLLWRSEFGGRQEAGSAVPVETVWRKILLATDISTLEIRHDGKKAGYCHWSADPGRTPVKNRGTGGEELPEGMAGKISGYRLGLDGNVALTNSRDHVHFETGLKLATNEAWQEFSLRFSSREYSLALRASAAEQKIFLSEGERGDLEERTISLADLANPQALAREFGLPEALLAWPGLSATPGGAAQAGRAWSPGLVWEARTDRLQLGHAAVRAYRLQTKVLDRFPIVIMVSPVGEILRVELPGGWTLVNEQLANL